MALLAEEIVEEWLNRQGYFTIRGIKVGVDEIDILAMRLDGERKPICRHIEVQASINPVSYLTPLPKDLQKQLGIGGTSMKRREPEVLRRCVEAWINKKFLKPSKAKIKRNLCGSEWTHELVVNRVKHEEELEIISEMGITVHRLRDLIREMTSGGMMLKSASGRDLIDLVLLGKDDDT